MDTVFGRQTSANAQAQQQAAMEMARGQRQFQPPRGYLLALFGLSSRSQEILDQLSDSLGEDGLRSELSQSGPDWILTMRRVPRPPASTYGPQTLLTAE